MTHRYDRRRLALVFGLCLGIVACGSPKPEKKEIVEGLRKQIASRQEAVKKQPRRAREELALMIESLDNYAKQYGSPFDKIREKATAMQSAWGEKADAATMKKDFDAFVEDVSKLEAI